MMVRKQETKASVAAQESQAPDASRHAAAMLDIMEQLGRVMEAETATIKKRDYDALPPLQVERAKWMRDYHANLAILNQNPGLLKGVSAEEKKRLRERGEIFARTAQMYSSCLRAAISATQALVQTVMDVARQQNKSTDCYTDPRKTPLMLGKYSPICAPVAVNRTA